MAAMFRALGDSTRLRIFEFLRCCSGEIEIDEGGRCRPAASLSVGEVCCRFEQGMSTISRHLKELRLAGLIRMEKRGRWIYCSVEPSALERIRTFAEAACCPGPPGGSLGNAGSTGSMGSMGSSERATHAAAEP